MSTASLVVHTALSLLVGLGLAAVLFRALDVRSHAAGLVRYRRWLRRGLAAVAVYLLALPLLVVAGAVPYARNSRR